MDNLRWSCIRLPYAWVFPNMFPRFYLPSISTGAAALSELLGHSSKAAVHRGNPDTCTMCTSIKCNRHTQQVWSIFVSRGCYKCNVQSMNLSALVWHFWKALKGCAAHPPTAHLFCVGSVICFLQALDLPGTYKLFIFNDLLHKHHIAHDCRALPWQFHIKIWQLSSHRLENHSSGNKVLPKYHCTLQTPSPSIPQTSWQTMEETCSFSPSGPLSGENYAFHWAFSWDIYFNLAITIPVS